MVRAVVEKAAASRWFCRYGPRFIPQVDRTVHAVTGGRVMMSQVLVPTLLLTTSGHRTGLSRSTPLACLPEPGGSFLVVASNFGLPSNPAWSANLLRKPQAQVSFHGRKSLVTASLLTSDEKAQAWPSLLQIWPVYQRYTEMSGRDLLVFRLQPTAAKHPLTDPPGSSGAHVDAG
jgi:deazaflavin-dependent oxidoreductase (nitroreductase family)